MFVKDLIYATLGGAGPAGDALGGGMARRRRLGRRPRELSEEERLRLDRLRLEMRGGGVGVTTRHDTTRGFSQRKRSR